MKQAIPAETARFFAGKHPIYRRFPPQVKGAEFVCQDDNCNGSTIIVDETHVLHICTNKYSLQLGKQLPFERVQINPQLTNGEIKYNWFVQWD